MCVVFAKRGTALSFVRDAFGFRGSRRDLRGLDSLRDRTKSSRCGFRQRNEISIVGLFSSVEDASLQHCYCSPQLSVLALVGVKSHSSIVPQILLSITWIHFRRQPNLCNSKLILRCFDSLRILSAPLIRKYFALSRGLEE